MDGIGVGHGLVWSVGGDVCVCGGGGLAVPSLLMHQPVVTVPIPIPPVRARPTTSKSQKPVTTGTALAGGVGSDSRRLLCYSGGGKDVLIAPLVAWGATTGDDDGLLGFSTPLDGAGSGPVDEFGLPVVTEPIAVRGARWCCGHGAWA